MYCHYWSNSVLWCRFATEGCWLLLGGLCWWLAHCVRMRVRSVLHCVCLSPSPSERVDGGEHVGLWDVHERRRLQYSVLEQPGGRLLCRIRVHAGCFTVLGSVHVRAWNPHPTSAELVHAVGIVVLSVLRSAWSHHVVVAGMPSPSS